MKNIRLASLLFSIAVFCTLFTGCNPLDKTAISITLVAAQQSNQPAPSLNLIDSELKETARTFGTVNLIRLGGKPTLVDTLEVPPQKGLMTDNQLDRIASEQVAAIQSKAIGITAVEPESDLLAALRLAGRTVKKEDGRKNVLIVFSNGINTVAPLDLSTCVLHNMDIDATVQELQAQQAIPDLSPYEMVKIYQLGETESPQEPLTETDRAALKELWRGILLASGLSDTQISFPDDPPAAAEKAEGLPPIKTVTVIQPSNAVSESAAARGINITLSENSVAFLPNKAEIADPEAARQALQPTADTLMANRSLTVVVAGQTATVGNAESCRALSLQRADSISALLQTMGVPASQLQTVGLGYDPANPLHGLDTDKNGDLVEEAAQNNRIVTILDASSPLAQQILNIS